MPAKHDFKIDDLVIVDDEVMLIIGIINGQYRCMNHETKSGLYSKTELTPHKGTSLYDTPQRE